MRALRQMRVLLSNGWIQGRYAQDKEGQPCAFDSPTATAFCLAGAFHRVSKGQFDDVYHRLICAMTMPENHEGLVSYNDTHTKAQVLALIEKAITQSA